MCDRYQGCLPETFGGEDYCCICKTRIHYSLEKLNSIKHNNFKLQKFYLNLLRDPTEIERTESTACFWEGEFYYKYKNWQKGPESQTYLRHVNDLFNMEID